MGQGDQAQRGADDASVALDFGSSFAFCGQAQGEDLGLAALKRQCCVEDCAGIASYHLK